jgi:hypothetical protein
MAISAPSAMPATGSTKYPIAGHHRSAGIGGTRVSPYLPMHQPGENSESELRGHGVAGIKSRWETMRGEIKNV